MAVAIAKAGRSKRVMIFPWFGERAAEKRKMLTEKTRDEMWQ
jgi:hypothetical protein